MGNESDGSSPENAKPASPEAAPDFGRGTKGRERTPTGTFGKVQVRNKEAVHEIKSQVRDPRKPLTGEIE